MLRFSVHRLNRRIQQLAPRRRPSEQRACEESAASKPTHICDLSHSINGTYAANSVSGGANAVQVAAYYWYPGNFVTPPSRVAMWGTLAALTITNWRTCE